MRIGERMDFWGALRVLRRRWYIALPSALLAVGLAAGVFVSIPTRYESTGVMVFTSPSAGGTFNQNVSPEEAVKINPLLAFDGSLSTTSQIIAQILADPKTREGLGITQGSTANFTAAGGGVNGPFMFVVTDAESPDEAEKLVTTVLTFAQKELEDQQRKLSAPESTFITSQVIVNPTTAEAQIGGKVRYAGAAFVLLMLFTLAATFASDSVMGKLKRRREAEAEVDGEGEDSEEVSAEPGEPRSTGAKPADFRPDNPRPHDEPPHGAPRQPLNGQPRRPEPPQVPGHGPQTGQQGPQQGPPPRPPVRRSPTASEQTVKVQPPTPLPPKPRPTASERTVKIAAVGTPDNPKPPGGAPGAPGWPTREDSP
ncbi:hypothetical protein ACFFSW_04210 [Saccharothrix longispora]|uniref:Capsular polysaccharide biosynthesis protein n=1 Tax=Saccharothrix longispora TaxID=33920 RepID=A0ABU1PN15_9PSEU|nr:hypothetical protein [Saccharothrix longispora]MDR6592057.1 hypothetical protein [Saccharothrix longispora]